MEVGSFCVLTRDVEIPDGDKTALKLAVGHAPKDDWIAVSKKKIAALCWLVLFCVVAARAGRARRPARSQRLGARAPIPGYRSGKVQGVEFVLPPKNWFTDHLIKFGLREPLDEAAFGASSAGHTFVDVGAHYGYYTLIAARLVGDKGRVVAFEPDPTSFAVLKKNVEHNGFQNVVLENLAASNAPGKVRLYLTASAMEDSVIDAGQAKEAIDVQAVRLTNDFANSPRGLDVIKIDTEGAEAIILQGMQNILRKNRSLRLVIEYSPKLLKAAGTHPKKY